MSNSSSTDPKKLKNLTQARQANVLESLKDIGSGTTKSLKEDLLAPASKDFFNQLLRSRMQNKHFTGEIKPGEEVAMNSVFTGQREKEEKLKSQLALERRLREDERSLTERKAQELRVQLHAIMQELKAIAVSTPQLVREVEIAAVQAPVNPGVYHLRFFEKLFEFVQSFRKNIKETSAWLHTINKRASKGKNVWGANYKQMKGKYLLSSEHYLQRSAG